MKTLTTIMALILLAPLFLEGKILDCYEKETLHKHLNACIYTHGPSNKKEYDFLKNHCLCMIALGTKIHGCLPWRNINKEEFVKLTKVCVDHTIDNLKEKKEQ